jgi:ABC-type amino acid transport substrate-binding protein
MMRWIAILAVSLGLHAGATRGETMVVVGGDNFAPTTYLNHGVPAGTLVDILNRVSKKTGDVYEIRLFPWTRAYELATRGESAILGISITPQRLQTFDFSDPLYYNELQLVVAKGKAFPFTRLQDLKGRSLGGGLGVSYGADVDAALTAGLFTLERDTDASIRLQKVLSGQLDAAIIGHGMPGLDSIVKGHPRLRSRQEELAVLPRPLDRNPLYLATAKSMQKRELLERFNKALAELQRSGELTPMR